MSRAVKPMAMRASDTPSRNVAESWGVPLGDMGHRRLVACMIRQAACMSDNHRTGWFRRFGEHHSAQQSQWLQRQVSSYLGRWPNRVAPVPDELARVLALQRLAAAPAPPPPRPPPPPPALNGQAMANRFRMGRESIIYLQQLLKS